FPQLRGKRFLLFLGRLHEKKGCDLLIEAFSGLRNKNRDAGSLYLVMAGPCADDDYLEHLKRLAATDSGADDASVVLCGMLEGNLIWGALCAAVSVILPSHPV